MKQHSHSSTFTMDLIFPLAIGLLLILFLATNFEWVATVLSYVLMIGLVILVISAISYGLYDKLGPEISILLGIVALGVLTLTRFSYAIAGFIKGFGEGYRSGPAEKV